MIKTIDSAYMKTLGEKLKNERKWCGMSIEYVALRLNSSRNYIANWEANNTLPNIFQLAKILRLYDITFEELIEGTELEIH